MLTQDNTTGYSDDELELMNTEVKHLMMNYEPEYGDKKSYLQWAEESVLKKHGGA